MVDGKLLSRSPACTASLHSRPKAAVCSGSVLPPRAYESMGLAENRLLVETDAGFTSLEARDRANHCGITMSTSGWTRACGRCGRPALHQAEPVAGEQLGDRLLVWVDLASGSTQGGDHARKPQARAAQTGPACGRWASGMAFFGHGEQTRHADVVGADAQGGGLRDRTAAGLGRLESKHRSVAACRRRPRISPATVDVAGRPERSRRRASSPEWHRKNRCSARSPPPRPRPLSLVRRVAVPAEGNPGWPARVGNDPRRQMEAAKSAAGQTQLLEQRSIRPLPAEPGKTWRSTSSRSPARTSGSSSGRPNRRSAALRQMEAARAGRPDCSPADFHHAVAYSSPLDVAPPAAAAVSVLNLAIANPRN